MQEQKARGLQLYIVYTMLYIVCIPHTQYTTVYTMLRIVCIPQYTIYNCVYSVVYTIYNCCVVVYSYYPSPLITKSSFVGCSSGVSTVQQFNLGSL